MRERACGFERNEFACDVCASPAVTFPAVLDDDQTVLCARCRAPLGSYGEFRRRLARMIDVCPDQPRVTGC